MHRGRIQSQGGKIEDSENWNYKMPISEKTAKHKINILKSRHSKKEQRLRTDAFNQAYKFIDNSKTALGADAQVSKTFMVKGSKNERVDIEVITGKAFV